jgi:hypothetical protein
MYGFSAVTFWCQVDDGSVCICCHTKFLMPSRAQAIE